MRESESKRGDRGRVREREYYNIRTYVMDQTCKTIKATRTTHEIVCTYRGICFQSDCGPCSEESEPLHSQTEDLCLYPV